MIVVLLQPSPDEYSLRISLYIESRLVSKEDMAAMLLYPRRNEEILIYPSPDEDSLRIILCTEPRLVSEEDMMSAGDCIQDVCVCSTKVEVCSPCGCCDYKVV